MAPQVSSGPHAPYGKGCAVTRVPEDHYLCRYSSTCIITYMAYLRPPIRVKWDRPGPFQGVTIEREIDGEWFAWKVPYNGVVPQAMAADILGVSLMAVNNWVRSGTIKHIKPRGEPSLIPLREIKKVRKVLHEYGRLRRDALDQ